MDEIVVKSQAEWNQIPDDYQGYVLIRSDEKIFITERKGIAIVLDSSSVDACGDAVIVARDSSSVEVSGNAKVEAWASSTVKACGNASVVAKESSTVQAWDNVCVVAKGSASVVARGNSNVVARESSSVKAWENVAVEAWNNSSVETRGRSRAELRESSSLQAWDNSSVVAREKSSVVAWGNSNVEACDNSSVVAWENSSVEASGNSSIEAWGNSSIVAKGCSSVEAWGNVQIVRYSDQSTIKIHGNARVVTLPKTIEEYCDFYDITVKDGSAMLYKAVRSDLGSFDHNDFVYNIGQTVTNSCDSAHYRDYSYGMHIFPLSLAIDFGLNQGNFKIIECAVPLDKIVLPNKLDFNQLKTSELQVVREVPVEEWGTYKNFLQKG